MKIDQYSLLMISLTVALIAAFAFTGSPVMADLCKVTVGATILSLAKKAETTVVVADEATAKVVAAKMDAIVKAAENG